MNENILTALLDPCPSQHEQTKALMYFDELKNSDYGWQVCLETLSLQKYSNAQIQFFCFQVLEHHIKLRYNTSSLEHQNVLRKFLCQWVQLSQSQLSYSANFLKNKVAQVFSLVFVQDYPTRWPTFFGDLHSTLQLGEQAVDHYLRVLLAIDSEVADHFVARSNQELQRNTLLKDKMRENDVVQLVNSWYQILTTFEKLYPKVASLCLQVISKYILWIDLSLVVNDNFVPVLVKHLSDKNLRESSADCIHAIINKGMDPVVKIKLVESFDGVLSSAGTWQAFEDDSDSDFLCKLGKLCSSMAQNLIDCYWKLTKSNNDEMKQICKSLQLCLHKKYLLMLNIMGCDFDDVSLTVLDFQRHYLQLLKSKGSLTETDLEFFRTLLAVLIEKLSFGPDYDYNNPKEDEAEFDAYRKQLKIVLDNMIELDMSEVLTFVLHRAEIYISDWRSFSYEKLEVALTLIYYMGENATISGFGQFCANVDYSSKVQMMLVTVMESKVQSHNHSAVVMRYFDVVARYVNFFQVQTRYINDALSSFLKSNGVFHTDMKIRSRCAYLLCRFVKCVRALLSSDQTEEILICIQPLLELATPNNKFGHLLSNDDQLYLYEIAGMVIVSGERVASKKGDLMRQAIGPLIETCKLVTEQLGNEKDPEKQTLLAEVIVQAISVTGRASKAFSGLHNMKNSCCSPIFVEALQIFLRSLDVPSGNQLPILQSAVRQYLHRMVVCLEVDVLPYFPSASESLLRNCDSKSIQEYIPLINQVITKFKKEVTPFLNQMFAPMVRCIFNALVVPIETNDLQAVRERQMLQRQYYHFIAAIVTNNLTEVLSVQDAQLLQQVMLSIIQGSVEFPDAVAQKACFSILKKLVETWGSNGPEGFMDFMYKNIVPVCFLAPLKDTFDLTDAQTLLALNEIALCLKAIFDKRGDEFIVYVQVHYLPTLDMSPEKIQEFIAAVRFSTKYFKTFMKNFFLSLRTSS